MSLFRYLTRLENTLRSRGDLFLDTLRLTVTSIGALFEVDVRFYDGSRLIVTEEIEQVGQRGVRRLTYKFHYQEEDGTLIFRYDNVPHYPHLSTFPSHKHVGDSVIEAQPRDLSDVLREIDAIIYPEPEEE
ncbi:MAG: hypothetical protein MAG451_01547 [Anaerolineales bacterium]|nr:hypothetical protein [Anaerolineales bacterium]